MQIDGVIYVAELESIKKLNPYQQFADRHRCRLLIEGVKSDMIVLIPIFF